MLEFKLWRGERTLRQGVEQLSRYLRRLGEQEGYLVLFDRMSERDWEEKLYEQECEGPQGQRLHAFGV